MTAAAPALNWFIIDPKAFADPEGEIEHSRPRSPTSRPAKDRIVRAANSSEALAGATTQQFDAYLAARIEEFSSTRVPGNLLPRLTTFSMHRDPEIWIKTRASWRLVDSRSTW